MNIQPICVANAHSQASSKNHSPNFKTKLKLTFSPYSIPCNYNRGELSFAKVISRFEDWLRNQSPSFETLTIRQKTGKNVNILQTKRNGVFQGDSFINSRPENLEFEMCGARSGFCWNEQSSNDCALEDLKNTFNYVKSQAGY